MVQDDHRPLRERQCGQGVGDCVDGEIPFGLSGGPAPGSADSSSRSTRSATRPRVILLSAWRVTIWYSQVEKDESARNRSRFCHAAWLPGRCPGRRGDHRTAAAPRGRPSPNAVVRASRRRPGSRPGHVRPDRHRRPRFRLHFAPSSARPCLSWSACHRPAGAVAMDGRRARPGKTLPFMARQVLRPDSWTFPAPPCLTAKPGRSRTGIQGVVR